MATADLGSLKSQVDNIKADCCTSRLSRKLSHGQLLIKQNFTEEVIALRTIDIYKRIYTRSEENYIVSKDNRRASEWI